MVGGFYCQFTSREKVMEQAIKSPHVFTNLKIFKQFFTVIIRNIIINLDSYLRVFTILIQLDAKP